MATNESIPAWETAKSLAAFTAIDALVRTNTKVIGIGSGSTISCVVDRLADLVWNHCGYHKIIFIPASQNARMLLMKHNLSIGRLEEHPVLDLYIDGADEVDVNLNAIKGGHGYMCHESIIEMCAAKSVIVADYRKKSERLGENWCRGIPIEVIPMGWRPISMHIKSLFGGQLLLKMGVNKDGPVVTDVGCYVLDWYFSQRRNYDWQKVYTSIKMLPGVTAIGISAGIVTEAYFGMADGTVIQKCRNLEDRITKPEKTYLATEKWWICKDRI